MLFIYLSNDQKRNFRKDVPEEKVVEIILVIFVYTQVRKNSLHIIINFISYLEQPKPVLKCEISHVCLSQIRKSKNYPFFLELVLPLVGMVWGSWPA